MSKRTDFLDAARSLATTIERDTDATVRLAAPAAATATATAAATAADSATIDIHLLGVRQQTRERHRGVVVFPVELDHLVSVSTAGDDASGVLYDVLTAVEGSADHELSPDDVPIDWWTAFGVTPRPAIRVRTPVRLDRVIDEAPVVTEELILDQAFHQPAEPALSAHRKA